MGKILKTEPYKKFQEATNCDTEDECTIADNMFKDKPKQPLIRWYFRKDFVNVREHVYLEWRFGLHIFSKKKNKYSFRRRISFTWKFEKVFRTNEVKDLSIALDYANIKETPLPFISKKERVEKHLGTYHKAE